MEDYIAPDHKEALEKLFPDLFEGLWELKAPWVEPKNSRRGGWSGAKRVTLEGFPTLFMKKQENHCFRALRNGFRRRPTLEREAVALAALTEKSVSVPPLIYYGSRVVDGRHQALLLEPNLEGYLPLDELMKDESSPWHQPLKKRQIIKAVGSATRQMHDADWHHRHFHPKHVLLNFDEALPKVYFVDLEKARPIRRRGHDVIEDLGPLFRRTKTATLFDRALFMRAYSHCKRLGSTERQLMKRVAESS
ncbi:MAG: tRNA A-37 threonylcarbamoyl transferase component Bud32 [Verrucomicrobiales bacterium]|jgi:tRNA A-37 threonylcarbamoyl transferase component Bud32